MPKVKVYIIDEMPVMRHGLTSLLKSYPGYDVVGEAPNIKLALNEVEELEPDIIVIDIYRDGGGGVKAISKLQQKLPKANVLVLTDSTDKGALFSSMEAGAGGYLLKRSELNEIVDSIRLIASGGMKVYGSGTSKMFDLIGSKDVSNPLSVREQEILYLVSLGLSNREISEKCFIREATVKSHLRRISEKLNVNNRAEAVAIALKSGFLEEE